MVFNMNVLLSESALLEDEMKRLKYFVVCHNNKDDTVIVYDPESITTYQARYAACVLRGGWDFLFTTTKTGNEKNSVVQISPVSSFERAFRSVLSYMEKLPTLHPVRLQISRNVHEDLVDGIHDDIFRGDVFQIDAVNLRAVFHVVRHTRRGNHKINCKFRPAVQFREGTGCAVQIPPRRFPAPLVVHLGDALLYLEQPAAARYAKGFDCRGRRQADSLVRPTFICND